MEPEGSLPHSQVPTTCPHPEPARSSPYHTSHFLKIHLHIVIPFTSGYPKRSASLRPPHQNPVYASKGVGKTKTNSSDILGSADRRHKVHKLHKTRLKLPMNSRQILKLVKIFTLDTEKKI
jgi:hypothetical protein